MRQHMEDNAASAAPSATLAVARVERLPIAGIADLQVIAQAIAQSGMFGVTNAGAGLVVAATCHSQGISLMEFQRTYHIVQGRPSMRSDAMLAEFRKRGGRVKIAENSVNRAAVVCDFEGQRTEWSFSMDDARRTGDCYTGKTDKSGHPVLKDNWAKRPEDMLWARVVSRMVRRLCPEINAGTYTPEETEDFADAVPAGAKTVTAITVDEAKSRAVNAGIQVAVDPPQIDYEVCPEGFGEYSGKRWDTIESKTLLEAYEAPGLEDGHRSAIYSILTVRGDA